MSAGTIPQAAFDRIDSVMKRALAGLSAEQLRTQPAGPDSNPIGWMAWHLSRVHDTNFSNLLGQGQAWVTEGWHERFGLPAALGSGGGDSLDDVRAFDPIAAATTTTNARTGTQAHLSPRRVMSRGHFMLHAPSTCRTQGIWQSCQSDTRTIHITLVDDDGGDDVSAGSQARRRSRAGLRRERRRSFR